MNDDPSAAGPPAVVTSEPDDWQLALSRRWTWALYQASRYSVFLVIGLLLGLAALVFGASVSLALLHFGIIS